MPVQNSSSDSTKQKKIQAFLAPVFLMGRNKVKKSPYAEITSLKTSVLKFVYKQTLLALDIYFSIPYYNAILVIFVITTTIANIF